MPIATIQTSFNGGELSPRMAGRPDLAAYQNGVAELTNMVPLVQGPVTKRPGTRFVAKAKSQGTAARLIPFVPRASQAYIIEASDRAFRFFTNNGLIGGAGTGLRQWLANSADQRAQTTMERFDPRFWTVDFPRPMMAAVTATGARSLNVNLSFLKKNDIAGLIWDSVDRYDHPLLAYATSRDYRDVVLQFRWQASGDVRALDVGNGPVLTIEGHDAGGAPRTWYVRLWNYRTSGSATDAIIQLNFAALDGGFTLPADADRVYGGAIDRMFISMTPAGYDGSNAPLAARQEAVVTLSNITATGVRASLPLGNAQVPINNLSAATGYDDSYNQTPARVLRNLTRSGYAGLTDHYVGMSHFYQLEWSGSRFVVVPGTPLNAPTIAWHQDYAARTLAAGLTPIMSLSYELFSENVVEGWQQRDAAGNPAATGYAPPSTLLSPTIAGAQSYLAAVAVAFVNIMVTAGHAPHFQVGEPWWWVGPEWRPCFYDSTTTALYTTETGRPVPPAMIDVRGALDSAQTDYMDWLGGKLAASTMALAAAVQAAHPSTRRYLLVYTVALLDGAAPELHRANLPTGWTYPAFDVLQIEDYEFVTAGNLAGNAATRAIALDTLAYPLDRQNYLSGFATAPGDTGQWLNILNAAKAATSAGIARVFIWAMPQVVRDGAVIIDSAAADSWTDAAVPSGDAIALATPWTADELPLLNWQQSNDVLYIVDGVHPPRRLARNSATSFSLSTAGITGGPFKDMNTDEAISVSASATSGEVTLQASAAIFAAGHAGGLFYLEIVDFRSIAAWEPGIEITVGDLRRSDGKVYKAISRPVSKRTGSVQPTHVRGREYDGMGAGKDANDKDAGGVLWEYQYGKFGIARITGISGGGLTATATVEKTLPDNVVGAGNASWRWAHGAFSDAEGWPSCVTLWNQRLIYAKRNAIYASVVGDFTNFAPRDDAGLLTADQALRYSLAASDDILWIDGDRQLIVGTAKAEYALQPASGNSAFSASNITAPRQSVYGSAAVRPVLAGTRILFVQRGGRKLRQMAYEFNADRYVSPDMTVRAQHITKGGVLELTAQAEPEALIWARRGDGALLALTFAEDEQVRGWSRMALGGGAKVESVAAVPAPDNGSDQLWLATVRTLASGTLRSIERLETFRDEGDAIADAYFLDCGLTYSGAPVSQVAGLDHLIGETVTLLIDGATHPPLTVDGSGRVLLANGLTGRTIHAGLPYTARLTTMRIDHPAQDGSVQGRVGRIVKLALRLLDTVGLRIGGASGRFDEIFQRRPATPMGNASPAFTGDMRVGFPDGYSIDGKVTLENSEPLPWTLSAIMPASEAGSA